MMSFVELLNSLQISSGIILLILTFYVYQFRKMNLAKSLMTFLFLNSWWCCFAGLIFLFDDLETKIFLNRLKLVGAIFLPISILNLTLAINDDKIITRKTKAMLFILPAFFSILVLSPYHDYFITGYELVTYDTSQILTFKNGNFFKFHNIISRVMVITALVLIYLGTKSKHYFHKRLSWIVMIAIILPFMVDTVGVYFFQDIRYFQLVPVSLGFTSMFITYAIFVHGFLEVFPFARSQVVANLKDPCLMWDLQGRLVDCNKAAIEIFSIPKMLKNHSLVKEKLIGDKKDEIHLGGKFYKIKNEKVLSADKRPIGEFTLLNDITDNIKREEELSTLNSIKTNILGVLSHDLMGHLGQVSLMSDVLSCDYDSLTDESRKKISHGISQISKDLTFFIEDLLIWSKLQYAGWRLLPQKILIKDLVDEVLGFTLKAIPLGLRKILNTIESDFEIKSDYQMLKIVLRNFIFNSIKHSPYESDIKIWSIGNHLFIFNETTNFDENFLSLYSEKENDVDVKSDGLGHKICNEFVKVLGLSVDLKQEGKGVCLIVDFS